mmetsp:Transcript_28982/g.33150  ORF Transcript_28982/g.33150 Transcript_28982/m.33150 type:complete len:157 (+) Transcript_28982:161-631(+)
MGKKEETNYVYKLIGNRLICNILRIGTWGSFFLVGGFIVGLGFVDEILFYCLIHLAIAALPCILYLTCCSRGIEESRASNEKQAKFSLICMIVSIIFFVIGAPIALGIHFGIYYPLKVQDWESAQCTLKEFGDASRQLPDSFPIVALLLPRRGLLP